jgi:hypothetical protein
MNLGFPGELTKNFYANNYFPWEETAQSSRALAAQFFLFFYAKGRACL